MQLNDLAQMAAHTHRSDKLLDATVISSGDVMKYYDDEGVIAKVIAAEEWRNELIKEIQSPEEFDGATLPWGITHDKIRFRPGETTVWAGINGHGKSQLLGMVSLGFIAQGQRVLNMSFEMKPLATLKRMLRQCAMNSNPDYRFVDRFMDFLTGRAYIFDHLGSINERVVYAAIRYAALERKVNHIIIDSMMKCVKGSDDYSSQKDFMNSITRMAQQYGVHIHVVHHIKKLESEECLPNKFDLKGDSSISDMPDQVLTVWRNKRKERAIKKSPTDPKANEAEDALLVCDKNRHGEWEGHVRLWYHPPSLQYTADSRCMPLDLMGSTKQ